METLWQDIRYATRALLKKPGFTLVVIFTLSLGIGANTAIFSVVNAVLLAPPPFRAPERVVRLGEANPGWSTTLASSHAYIEWKERSTTFEKMARAHWYDGNLETGAEPQHVMAVFASADYFTALGVEPLLGRTFEPGELGETGHQVVAISHGLWQRLGSDPRIVGQTLRLDGESQTVIGVMPPVNYQGPFIGWGDVWYPLFRSEQSAKLKPSGWRGITVIARLKDGVTVAQAQAELERVERQLAAEWPNLYTGYTPIVRRLQDFIVGDVRPALLALLGAVGFVLLIACANVANLLLVRAAGREKEMAVRAALGAGRARLARLLLTESLLLALAGAAAGLGLASLGIRALVALGPENLPGLSRAGLDWRVLGFTLLLSVITGLLFGLAPALAAGKMDLNEMLKDTARGAGQGARRQRLRNLLVVSEVALALMLLVGSGLALKSFWKLLRVDAGFRAERVLMLGVKPVLGRAFLPEEDRPGAERVVMLHHNLWQRRFGGDPNIVGQRLTLNGYSHTVIGVLPPEFHFFPVEITIAKMYGTPAFEGERLNQRESRFLSIIGKLKPGVSLTQAQSDVSAVTGRLAEQFPNTNAKRGVKLADLHEQVIGNVRLALWVLLGSVLFVLLIACANAANLLLAQAAMRASEMAVRAALGASRLRVLRQLLTESLLLAGGGGALGILLAHWTIEALATLNPKGLPRLTEINLDGRVLLFTGVVVLLTSIAFGLAPAWQTTKIDLSRTLKEGGRTGAGTGGARLRRGLVVAEIALAFVLLVGAGLLINSFSRLMQVDLGFNPQNVLKLSVSLPPTQYKDDQQKMTFIERALERINAVPGVEAAAAANVTPLTGYAANLPFDIENRPPALPGEQPNAEYRAVSADYFRALGMQVRRGRGFTEQDVKQSLQSGGAVIINEALAERYWPNEDPLGKRILIAKTGGQWREIAGIAGNIRQTGVEAAPLPELYEPTLRNAAGFYDIVIRSSVSPESLTRSMRAQFRELDPDLPLFTIRTLAETVQMNLARQRFAMQLLGAFAGLALVMACLGIYGVLAYSVARRTREIGLRMALGAQARDVLKLILRDAMNWVMAGGLCGLIIALALSRVLTNLLFGVTATDPLTFAGVALLLALVSLLASYIPARRAAKIDPMMALREE